MKIKLNLKAGYFGTVTVTEADGKVTTIVSQPSTSTAAITGGVPATTPLPADVESMVQRHEKNGAEGTRSRDLVHALIEDGWTVKTGPKYLRFIYTGSKGKVTLYANSRDIMTREYRDYADTINGALVAKNETRWRYIGDKFDQALAAADSLRAYVHLSDNATDGG